MIGSIEPCGSLLSSFISMTISMSSLYALCFRFIFRCHFLLTRTSGIQGCRVPELGSERFKQAAVDVRADHDKRCTANRGVCCKAQHACAVFRLSCVYILA